MGKHSDWRFVRGRRLAAVDHGDRGEVVILDVDFANETTGEEVTLVRVEEDRMNGRRSNGLALPVEVWREVLSLLPDG